MTGLRKPACTRIYNSLEEILSDADLAAGGQSDNQQVWFIRNPDDPRKIDFYTCFNDTGTVQLTAFLNDNTVATRQFTLHPAADFAFWINYVDNWVKGVGFDFGPLPPSPAFSMRSLPVPPQYGPLNNLTRACLIPLFDVVAQVEGAEAVALGSAG